MSEDNTKLKNEMIHAKKSRREILRHIEGMEERIAFLEDQNATLVRENNQLKDDHMKLYRFTKGLEWDIENICIYLEKQQDN